MLDNYGYKHTHTHRMYNTYCFSTATLLRERAPMLRYTYTACLFNPCESNQVSEWPINSTIEDILEEHTVRVLGSFLQLMEPTSQSPCSQKSTTGSYPKPAVCTPNLHTMFFWFSFLCSFYFQVPRILWPRSFVRSLAFLVYAISPAHFVIPYLLALALYDGHELWSSLCNFLKLCVT